MAQRTETDGGTAFNSPIVMVDSDNEVLGTMTLAGDITLAGDLTVSEDVTLATNALIKRIDTTLDCSADETAEATAVGTVPAGSVILGVVATVVTAFDGDTTTTFEVGITGNTDKYIDPSDFDPSAVAGTTIFSATGTNNDQKVLEYATAAIPVIATWTNTADPTAGSVRVQVLYV
jgi:hypothetical protein